MALSTFAEDAWFNHLWQGKVQGHAAIRKNLESLWYDRQSWWYGRQHLMNHFIMDPLEQEGTARVRCFFQIVQFNVDYHTNFVMGIGTRDDTVAKVDGKWLFRTLHVNAWTDMEQVPWKGDLKLKPRPSCRAIRSLRRSRWSRQCRFPDVELYRGWGEPMRTESTLRGLELTQGAIPDGLEGALYKVGADRQYPSGRLDDIFIDGEGMIHMFRFKDNQVDYVSRWVHTQRYKLQHEARRSLFGRYRNRYTNEPEVKGVHMGAGNTTAMFHAGHLYALKEDDLPHEIDPDTLETIEPYRFRRADQRRDLHGASEGRSGHERAAGLLVPGARRCFARHRVLRVRQASQAGE